MFRKANLFHIFSNIVLGIMFLLFLSALTYTWYRREALAITGFLIFYNFVFVAGFLFYLFSLCFRREWKINLALLTILMVVMIYCSEVISLIVDRVSLANFRVRDRKLKEQLAVEQGVYLDPRGQIKIVLEKRREGIDATPYLGAQYWLKTNGIATNSGQLFPLSGISNKTVVGINESGVQFAILEADEHGFNNPKGLYQKGNVEIALIGDSFTQGYNVQPEKNIAGQLRKFGFTVLNLGIAGNGPLAELATIKEYVEPIHPKRVFWLYCEGNDLLNILSERDSSILWMYYKSRDYTQRLFKRQSEVDKVLSQYLQEKMQQYSESELEVQKYWNNIVSKDQCSTFIDVIKLSSLRSRLKLTISSANTSTFLTLFKKILSEAKQRVSEFDCQFYFVYLPERGRYEYSRDGTYKNRDKVFSIVNELGIPIIDFHEVISNFKGGPLSLFQGRGTYAHYTPEGYRLVAEQIANSLNNESQRLKAR